MFTFSDSIDMATKIRGWVSVSRDLLLFLNHSTFHVTYWTIIAPSFHYQLFVLDLIDRMTTAMHVSS